MSMLVRFWGTRGSIAAPGPTTVRYGGNTSCVEVRAGESLIICDVGTGARALGGFLAAQGGPIRAHILLTHFHWDHIQGFPFFFPVFLPGSEVSVYGAAGLEQGLAEALSGQMQYTYFPVRLSELRSRLTFHEVGETSFQAGEVGVRTQFLNHTCPTLGYRLTVGGTSIAYMTDHEPFWPHNPELPLADALVHPGDLRHIAFVAGADLLIHDAQYTIAEYPARRGWGHSTVDYVVDVAVAARVRRLALFHHDPLRGDEALDELLAYAQRRARLRGADLEVFAAAEGQVVELPEVAGETPSASPVPTVVSWAPARVLVLGSPERRRPLREALVEEGYPVREAELDGKLGRLGRQRPDLVLVAVPPEADPAEVVRAASRVVPGRPVMAVLEQCVDEPTLRRVGEVAADVVITPFTPPILRARVRACLARRPAARARPRARAAERPPSVDTLSLVDRLSASELEAMLQMATRCGFRPGEVLFREGDPPGGAYYLHTGLVRIVVAGADGNEVTVGFAGPGDTVGEMSALDGAPRSATLIAMEPVEASYISREAFRQVLERAPQASVRLLRLLARRLREVDQRLASRGAEPVGPAVAARARGKADSAARGQADEPRAEAPATGEVRHRLARLEVLHQGLVQTEEQPGPCAQDATAASLRLREWRQGVQALRTIARLLGASQSPRGLYRQTVRALMQMVPSDAVGLYLMREAPSRRLERLASHGGRLPAGWPAERVPSLAEEAMRSGRPQVARWWSPGPDPAEVPGAWVAAVPLRAQGRSLGVLWLRRFEPPSEDQLALAEIVGAACAVAILSWEDSPQRGGAVARLADLESALELEVDRARRLGYPIGVLVGQVVAARPKRARGNGRRGPASVALAVRAALRRTDVVAASATGALGVILPGLTPEGLAAVEARVQEAIRRALGGRGGKNGREPEVRVGGSVGYPNEAEARSLLERALGALTAGEG